MINWPLHLISEIARRRCILFLGAGVAASAKTPDGKQPKEWKEFLTAALNLVNSPQTKEGISKLIDENKLLLALQVIYDGVDRGQYNSLMDDCFNDSRFKPSDLHKVIFDLDLKIVITTNFDKIYEKHCFATANEGFKIINYYNESLGDEIRTDTRLIIKAHGSIDEISKMIFTKEQYHKAKENHASFYEILKALLLTNTCIFIGCGMDDPDVLLLLEEVRVTANSSRPHYALLRKDSHTSFVKKDLQSTYNVACLEYGPDHVDLITDLKELLVRVESMRAQNPLA